MTPTNETVVILTKEEWLSWLSFARRAAVRRGVWNYINPDQDNLETYPAAPEPPVCPTLEQEDGNLVENIADLKYL